MVKRVCRLESTEQLAALIDPIRIRIVNVLGRQPATVRQVAEEIGDNPQKIHYHFRELEKHGLIHVVRRARKRNFVERIYRAVAKDFTVGPGLVQKLGQMDSHSKKELVISTLLTMGSHFQDEVTKVVNTLEEMSDDRFQQTTGGTAGVTMMENDLMMNVQDAKRFGLAYAALVKRFSGKSGGEGAKRLRVHFAIYPDPVWLEKNSREGK